MAFFGGVPALVVPDYVARHIIDDAHAGHTAPRDEGAVLAVEPAHRRLVGIGLREDGVGIPHCALRTTTSSW